MDSADLSVQPAPNMLESRNRHICAFFNGMDEHYRVLRSFITDGFDNGEKAFHLVDPERREDHLRRLVDAGIDVEEAVASGQLEVHPWEDGPLHGERFDQDTWLAGFEDVLKSGPASGYTKTRFLAQMEWALVDMPGIDDMIEFETRVNYVVPKYEDPVICAYDLSKFGASTVVYALRTHPVVIIGGLLQENPFYVDPDQLLLELRERSRTSATRSARSARRD
jgi:DcmR-like sensory protein